MTCNSVSKNLKASSLLLVNHNTQFCLFGSHHSQIRMFLRLRKGDRLTTGKEQMRQLAVTSCSSEKYPCICLLASKVQWHPPGPETTRLPRLSSRVPDLSTKPRSAARFASTGQTISSRHLSSSALTHHDTSSSPHYLDKSPIPPRPCAATSMMFSTSRPCPEPLSASPSRSSPSFLFSISMIPRTNHSLSTSARQPSRRRATNDPTLLDTEAQAGSSRAAYTGMTSLVLLSSFLAAKHHRSSTST